MDSEDSEEEIGMEKTERHVIKGDSETNVAVGGGSGCAGGDDGNGEETESNGADCEHDDANLDVSDTGDIIIQGKATAQAQPWQNHRREPHQTRPSFYIPNCSSTFP